MSPHYALTESSLLTHRRKGREGKGSRKGRTGVSPHASLRTVSGPSAHRHQRTDRSPSMHGLAPLGRGRR